MAKFSEFKKKRDEEKSKKIKEDQPTTLAPTSVATGQVPVRAYIQSRSGTTAKSNGKKFKESYTKFDYDKRNK